MATDRVLNKLTNLIGVELEARDVRFALSHWDDAPAKLQRAVVAWFKAQERVPAALQSSFIEADERAVRSISDLHPDTQELVLSDRTFKEDIPVMLSKARGYSRIHELLWKRLIRAVKTGDVVAAAAKALAKHNDCPEAFLKAAGIEPVKAERARRLDEATKPTTSRARRPRAGADETVEETQRARRPRVAKTEAEPERVRRPRVAKTEDADFDLPEEETVKTRRPRTVKAGATAGGAIAKVKETFHKAQERELVDPAKISHAVRTVRRPRV